MSSDALELFRAARPQGPPVPTGDIRAPSSNRSRELHGLAMVPGQPGYNERIPKPPCFQCGEDHWPNQSYDHPWTPEPAPIHDEPVQASPSFRRTEVIEVAPAQRLAIYVGRGDAFVLTVESPPDWDSVESWKVPDDQVIQIIKVVRALGIKIADKTGGELTSLGMHDDAGQHAQNNGRGAEGAGSAGPRRQGSPPDWTPEGEQERALPTPGGVH